MKFGSPYLGKAQQLQEQHYPFLLVCVVFLCVQTMLWLPVLGIFNVLQEQRYPFLLVCVVFVCVQTMLWLPVLGIFNVHTDANACDFKHRLHGHCKIRVCTGSWLWEKNSLLSWELQPASVLCLAFQLDALLSLHVTIRTCMDACTHSFAPTHRENIKRHKEELRPDYHVPSEFISKSKQTAKSTTGVTR